MIDKIKEFLSSYDKISAFKIIEYKINSNELFFIKKELHMDRIKDVHHFNITVYKDFEENGIKYRGSSTTKVHPTMTLEEIEQVLEDAAFAAGFVKNAYYPLTLPSSSTKESRPSNLSSRSLSSWLPELTDAIYKADIYENGCINSCELFLNKIYTRIINSQGVDIAFQGYKGQIEFITNWKEDAEEIELYKDLHFAAFDEKNIVEEVNSLLLKSKDKAIAKPTSNLKKFTVLLTGEPVIEFFKYYYMQANAKNVYEKISNASLGDNIQGKNTKGDLISIVLDPALDNSTNSLPYDEEGFPLEAVAIFENGVLNRLWGDVRHCYYLSIEPTGNIGNMVVQGGSKSIAEMKNEPYLELAAFSDFQMDPLTGDFAGEIRLGWYFDGETRIPVTGGSLSGNINKVQQEFYLSKELQKHNSFLGPKTIQLFDIAIAGN